MTKDFQTDELNECLNSIRYRHLDDDLPLAGKVCLDCPVKDGMYLIYSEALRLAPEEERTKLSKQWFCHNSPKTACRGNAENLDISW